MYEPSEHTAFLATSNVALRQRIACKNVFDIQKATTCELKTLARVDRVVPMASLLCHQTPDLCFFLCDLDSQLHSLVEYESTFLDNHNNKCSSYSLFARLDAVHSQPRTWSGAPNVKTFLIIDSLLHKRSKSERYVTRIRQQYS